MRINSSCQLGSTRFKREREPGIKTVHLSLYQFRTVGIPECQTLIDLQNI